MCHVFNVPRTLMRLIYLFALCQNGDQQQANIRFKTGISEQPKATVPVSVAFILSISMTKKVQICSLHFCGLIH